MDMKKLIRTVEEGKKPQPSDIEMKKFVSIIAEGKGPLNRLTQAEQIATQHYTKKETPIVEKKLTTSIDKYFKLVEQELTESTQKESIEKKIKAQKLAEKSIKKIGGNYGHHSNLSKRISQTKNPPENIIKSAMRGAKVDSKVRSSKFENTNPEDIITLNVPLLMRIMEYAKEDAKTDMDLHHAMEKMIELSKDGNSLSMDNYDAIVGDQKLLPPPDVKEEKQRLDSKCWKGYEKQGTKMKGGVRVNNCVKK